MKSALLGIFSAILFWGIPSHAQVISPSENSWIHDYLTVVPDFPQRGIQFQWYAKLLKDPDAFHHAVETFAERYRSYNLDAIAGLDSRGFIFGAALAYELRVPFVLIRKPGKLPRQVERIDYVLEYGKNSFEIEVDTIKPQDRVLIMDDVLATGGTVSAASELVERLDGKVVEVACLIEISPLEGRKRVKAPVFSLLQVE